jgi:hypothetical protein
MAAIDFPDNPVLDEVFTSGSRSWKWTGSVWQTVTTQKGSQGDAGGLIYEFSTTTEIEDPSSGFIRLDNSDVTLATAIVISDTTSEGADVSGYILGLASDIPDNNLSPIKYYLIAKGNDNADDTYLIYAVADVIPGIVGNYSELSVEYVAGTRPSNSERLSISLSRVGDLGPTGPETSIALGSVSTSVPGSTGAVSITGPAGSQVLSFVVPQGPTGPNNTLTIGSVVLGSIGTNPDVEITGSSPNQTLNFVIPQGPTGPTGPQGDLGTAVLDNLSDVSITGTPTQGSLLVYNEVTNNWENRESSGNIPDLNMVIMGAY